LELVFFKDNQLLFLPFYGAFFGRIKMNQTSNPQENQPSFSVGQKFQFTPGQAVVCNGYPGTVQRMYGEGMVEVRVPGGLTCVSASYPDCYPSSDESNATNSSKYEAFNQRTAEVVRCLEDAGWKYDFKRNYYLKGEYSISYLQTTPDLGIRATIEYCVKGPGIPVWVKVVDDLDVAVAETVAKILQATYVSARRLTIDVFGNSEDELRASLDGAIEGILAGQQFGAEFDANGGFKFVNDPLVCVDRSDLEPFSTAHPQSDSRAKLEWCASKAREQLQSVIDWTGDIHDMPSDISAKLEWYARRLLMIRNAARAGLEVSEANDKAEWTRLSQIEPQMAVAKLKKLIGIPDDWNLASDQTREQFASFGEAVCEKTIGGKGTFFVLYEMTVIRRSEFAFVPVHGTERMKEVSTIKEAVEVLEKYWEDLPDSHKLAANR
jgi:hypothetical protein